MILKLLKNRERHFYSFLTQNGGREKKSFYRVLPETNPVDMGLVL